MSTLSRQRRDGFTMLEMLIAVSISVIVVAGLYSLFSQQSRQFLKQDQAMNMHQNLRFASDILSRSGRMAGYGTGGEVYGVMGWDGSSADNSYGLPPIITWDAWSGSHDAVTFIYADPSMEMMTSPLTIETASTTTITFPYQRPGYSTKLSALSAGDLMICWDYANVSGINSFIWEIAADGHASGVVTVLDASSLLDYSSAVGANLPPVMHCSRAQVVTFYIDDNEADGVGPGSQDHPVLMMDLDFDFVDGTPDGDDIPLVDDIEDLQLAYCPAEGTCTDGSSDWVNTLTRDQSLEAWMMRYSLVSRSSRVSRTETEVTAPQSLENHAPTGTKDGYSRTSHTSKVMFRNLRLLHDF
ncbi:MAG: prepilin-type N-terminal cleavage/methylation domain-containing protein [Myxococcota bacterium]|nr:prepilin-type N-terminal cleavage/methylation domain-containing protein [Myxococcota bacterium]